MTHSDDDANTNSTGLDASDAEAGPTDGDGSEPPANGNDEVSRRWLIRLLVGLGIGIPILVEGTTFLRLVASWLGLVEGGGEGGTTTTVDRRRVVVGDELLLGTAPTETVRNLVLRPSGTGQQFVMSVDVQNTTNRTYELQLTTVRTADGQTVDGGGSTGSIDPGASGSVTGVWSLQEDASPESVVVVTRGGAGDRDRHRVYLGSVPVVAS